MKKTYKIKIVYQSGKRVEYTKSLSLEVTTKGNEVNAEFLALKYFSKNFPLLSEKIQGIIVQK